MRRSEWIAWLGVGGAYLLMMQGCGQDDRPLDLPAQVPVYPDIKACTEDGKPQLLCETAMKTAVRSHYARAPRYVDRTSCETVHGGGGCDIVSPPAGADYFAPAMAGFVLGSALGLDAAVPIYYDRNGYARVVGGDYKVGRRCEETEGERCGGGHGGGGSGGGSYSRGKHWVDTSSSNLRSVSRGGFGSSVHGVSS